MRDEGKRRRVLSYEERVLWSTVTHSVRPLRDEVPALREMQETPDVAVSEPHRLPSPKGVKDQKHAGVATHPQTRLVPPSKTSPSPTLLGRRMRRSVARGKAAIEARLDLHGLTQIQAYDALLRFLRAASARDARLVLVITGKGKRGTIDDERQRGVLRRQVPQWLSLPEIRDYVLGFEDAHVTHGGEGALYIRIRRAR